MKAGGTVGLYFPGLATIIGGVFHRMCALEWSMQDRNVFGQGCISRRATILLLAVLPFCCGGRILSAQAQTNNNPSSIRVSGTVLNSVTHEPIGRAMVYSTDSRYATFTDSGGRFELTITTVTPAGEGAGQFAPETVLQAKKPGFLADRGATGHAFVRASAKEVTLTLDPEGLIAGQVKFSSSETADQAQVVLYRREVRDGFGRWERLSEARTRSDGEYRFAELRAGQYKVFTAEAVDRDPLATGPGGPMYAFPPRFYAAAHDFASAEVIELHAGQTFTANMAPERQRYYEVRVPVLPAEAAEWGVSVAVRGQGQRGPGYELGYDPNEHAVRGSLPNGIYSIEGWVAGPTALTGITSITVANGGVLGPPLTLTENPSIAVNVRAQLTAADSSQVPTQTPTAYVTLQAAEEFSDERGQGMGYGAQTSPEAQSGAMRLQGVKPGRYWVQVQPSATDLYAASVTSGMTDLLRAPLVVPVGASVPPIEVTLRDDTGVIEATVEGVSGATAPMAYYGAARSGPAAPGADIYVWGIPSNGGAVRWFGERANGKYRLRQAPPGDYRVIAFDAPQEIEWRNPAALRRYESMGQVVHVSPGETVQVTLQVTSSE